MHKHYTVRFAKGALPLRTPTEGYFLDPELGQQKGRVSVLAGSAACEWGAAEGMVEQKGNLRPQARGTPGTPHIKVSWWGACRPQGARTCDLRWECQQGAHPA